MKTTLALTAFTAMAWAIPHPITLDKEWNEYKKLFGKFYTSEREDVKRLNAYLATKQRVEEHSRKFEKGETSYTMGINEFADWFPEELDMLNAFKLNEDELSKERKVFELPPGVEVPKEMNWVKKGAVTSVKNQGRCGSCYAFSAVGALEGLMYITNKTITNLSPQELVDCTSDYGNSGCNGGWMNSCFSYVAFKKGISTDKSYPYEAKHNLCRANDKQVGATCTGYMTIIDNEDNLKNAVGTAGPVSISLAVSEDFVAYKGGVFNGDCSEHLNHAMLAVGYGKDKKSGTDYWLVKNTWGKKWGMKGYAKIRRGVRQCGINIYGSFPVFENSSV